MNWEALGAIAELLGAIGVIATLGYLAVQIRQNTAVVRTSNFQGLMQANSAFTTTVAQDSELAEIYQRGLRDFAGLGDTEKTRFHMIMTEPFTVAQVTFQLNLRGLMDERLNSGYFDSFEVLLKNPGVREWWSSARVYWHEDFREFIDARLRSPAA